MASKTTSKDSRRQARWFAGVLGVVPFVILAVVLIGNLLIEHDEGGPIWLTAVAVAAAVLCVALLCGLTYWLLYAGYLFVIPYLMERVKHPERFAPLSVVSSKIAVLVGVLGFGGVLAMGVGEGLGGVEDAVISLCFTPFLAAFTLLLFAGLTYVAAMAVLGPMLGLFLGLRAGVREVEVQWRTSELDELPEDLRQLLSDDGLRAALGGWPPPTSWPSTVWKYHVGSLGIPLAVVGALGLALSIPLCANTVFDSSSHIPNAVGWWTPVISLLLTVGGSFLSDKKPPLVWLAIRQLRNRLGLPSAASSEPPSDPEAGILLDLPGGACVRWIETSRSDRIELALGVEKLPFALETVTRATLDAEDSDLDSGDEGFDLATLLRPAADGSAALPWLTPDFRAVLLALMHRGAYVRGGKVFVALDLSDGDALRTLDESLALLDRLWALYSAIAGRAPTQRAVAALHEAGGDSEREAILEELRSRGIDLGGVIEEPTDIPDDTLLVLERWAREGQGDTRITALKYLSDIDGPAAAVVDDLDESAGVRAAALALWMGRAAWGDRVTQAVLDDASLDLLGKTGQPAIERFIRALEDGDAELIDSLRDEAVPLTGNQELASLEERLDRCTPHADVGPALLRLCQRWHLRITAKRFALWMRFAALDADQDLHDWLEELARTPSFQADLKEAIETARKFVWLQLQRRRETQEEGQGALSLTEQDDGGQLSVPVIDAAVHQDHVLA